jgi:hypothetical protein
MELRKEGKLRDLSALWLAGWSAVLSAASKAYLEYSQPMLDRHLTIGAGTTTPITADGIVPGLND